MADKNTNPANGQGGAPAENTDTAAAPEEQTVPPIQTMPHDVAEEHHSRLFPILGVLLVILVIVLGGLYLWGAMLTEDAGTMDKAMNTNEENASAPQDELDAIEQDLNDEDFAAMETELDTIDREMESGMSAE